MRRWAESYQSFPEVVGLGHFAWPGLMRSWIVFQLHRSQRLFEMQGALVLPEALQEPVAGYLHQKGTQMGLVGKAPAGVAEAVNHGCPDRLDDVNRVELGPEPSRKLTTNNHPQVR